MIEQPRRNFFMRIETLFSELSCTLPQELSPETEITGVVYDSR